MPFKKNILLVLIFLMLGLFSVFMYLISQKKQNLMSSKERANNFQVLTEEQKQKQEQKQEQDEIKFEKGILENIDIGSITVLFSEKNEKAVLTIPDQNVFFVVKTKQADGSFLNEETALLDLPLKEEVEILYNEIEKQVLAVTVLK